MNDEIIDLVNEKDEVIGTVKKSLAHKNPSLIHREVGVIIFNDKDEVLLQQRSFNKKNDPGVWKNAAAGHILAGKNPIDAIKREAREELGIEIQPILYKKFFKRHIKKGENSEARFIWMYYSLCKSETRLIIDKKEVADAKWIPINQLKKFSQNNSYDFNGTINKLTFEIYNHFKGIKI